VLGKARSASIMWACRECGRCLGCPYQVKWQRGENRAIRSRHENGMLTVVHGERTASHV